MLISSGQPSLNPRLVKEADALCEADYQVVVIYAYWNNWGTELDRELIKSKKWTAICAGGDPVHQPLRYIISKIIYKAVHLLIPVTGLSFFSDIAIARSSFFLTRKANKQHADLYIGHNLGALPAVIAAAKKQGKPAAFDAEDYHRNEVTDDNNSLDVKLKSHIENKFIHRLNYLTVSSPLIGEAYQQLYPQVKKITLLNCFPQNNLELITDQRSYPPLKLFWFSQTVGLNRGIEDIIQALQLLSQHHFELHLLGDVSDAIREYFSLQMVQTSSTLHFYQPVAPDQIMAFAAQFDIGIASENKVPYNRNICLTNKIFTYIQAGLPVLASCTAAQSAFMSQYQIAGKIYNDAAAIAKTLLNYLNNPELLKRDKRHNYQLGQTTLNWDLEQQTLLRLVKQTINS